MEREAEDSVERGNEESAVFERREQAEIDNNRKCDKQFGYLSAAVFFYSERDSIIKYGAENQQAYPDRLTPWLEYKWCNAKNDIFRLVVLHDKIEEQGHGKEYEQKHETRKDHLISPFLRVW